MTSSVADFQSPAGNRENPYSGQTISDRHAPALYRVRCWKVTPAALTTVRQLSSLAPQDFIRHVAGSLHVTGLLRVACHAWKSYWRETDVLGSDLFLVFSVLSLLHFYFCLILFLCMSVSFTIFQLLFACLFSISFVSCIYFLFFFVFYACLFNFSFPFPLRVSFSFVFILSALILILSFLYQRWIGTSFPQMWDSHVP